MKYFKTIMKMGHVGKGKYREIPIYVYGKTFLEAMDFAKKLPGIKHGRSPLYMLEITKEEFDEGMAKNEYKKAITEGLGRVYEESNNIY